MGKLSDILAAGGQSGDGFSTDWNATTAAGDFEPLPPGWYVCRAESGELDASRHGTPGYKLTFLVLEGDHRGRKIWLDLWLTPAALPMTKRDLGKLGVVDLEQLENPLPPGIRCRAQVALRRDDNGTEHNRVKRFDVLGVDAVAPDPFAPTVNSQPEPTAQGEPQQQAIDLQGGDYDDS